MHLKKKKDTEEKKGTFEGLKVDLIPMQYDNVSVSSRNRFTALFTPERRSSVIRYCNETSGTKGRTDMYIHVYTYLTVFL